MTRCIFIIAIATFILLQSCSSTRRFGTTIERDENNPCQINMIIQVAIEGTPEDLRTVKSELEDCYKKECFIPCESDKEKGCLTKITVVVKSFSELKEDERDAFHYVQMVNNDGLPSNAYVGTPNSGASSGTWRRNEAFGTYCHEVLHFCGLRDKYCSRIYDPVTRTVTTEKICDPPPEPGAGGCCAPSETHTRCSTPCDGEHDNLMATTNAPLSCENILDVLKGAGFNNCPPECCSSNSTFSKPADETYILPGYFHFGEKNSKLGGYGVSIGGTKYIGSSLGLTLETGYYIDSEKQDDIKYSTSFLNITGGITYNFGNFSTIRQRLSVNAHALGGILRCTQKITFNDESESDHSTSLLLNVGASLNMRLNKMWTWRVLQADYVPTFFNDETQHNYRISTGIVYNLQR